MPTSFTVHEVAGGATAIAPDMAGLAVSKVAIVDLGDKTAITDTFMTVRAAEGVAAFAERRQPDFEGR